MIFLAYLRVTGERATHASPHQSLPEPPQTPGSWMWEQQSLVGVRGWGCEGECLHSSCALYSLRGLVPFTLPLRASVFWPVKWGYLSFLNRLTTKD